MSSLKKKPSRGGGSMWFGVLVATALVAAYSPALGGGMLWDDAGHLTRPELQSMHGLWRIWFDVGATQQYYPLLHSAFWIAHQLFGDNLVGYHLLTLALHATAAWFVMRVAQQLAIPGAPLAGLLFALHPMQVESVAWMSEMKNTLSAVCVLWSLHMYLRFDDSGRRADYIAAVGLFVCALLSKSVTAPLPIVILLCVFFRTGAIRARELARMVPFVAVAIIAGATTVWIEAHQIGAAGDEFALAWGQRLMLAGRVPWFYLSKILWPADLSFFYPRWPVAQWTIADALPLAMTIAVVVVAIVLAMRQITRGPLTAVGCYLALLAPAAGLVNAYPFRFSYVANHFAYLAMLAVVVPAAACITLAVARFGRRAPAIVALALIAVLGTITFVEAQAFVDNETLYRRTIARNPHVVVARTNLAEMLIARRTAAALAEAERLLADALVEDPNDLDANFNRAVALELRGQMPEAAAQYQRVTTLWNEASMSPPRRADVYHGLARSLAAIGRQAEAIAAFRSALRDAPNDAALSTNFGLALARAGAWNDALPQLERASQLAPSAATFSNLGAFLLERHDFSAAAAALQQALTYDPRMPEARYNFAVASLKTGEWLLSQGNVVAARERFTAGLAFADGDALLRQRLSDALRAAGGR